MSSPEEANRRQASAFAILSIAFLAWFRSNLATQAIDFGVYWDAVQRWKAGLTAYQSGIHLQYKYSPGTTALFRWLLGSLDFDFAFQFFKTFTTLLWALGLSYFFRHRAWIGLVIVAIVAPSIAEEIKLGQINIVPLLLWMGPVILFGTDKKPTQFVEIWIATLLAIAVGLKLFVVLWIPVLIFSRQYRLLAWSLIAGIVLNLILPILSLGVSGAVLENQNWLVHLFESSSELLGSRYNASLLGVLIKWGLPIAWARLIWVAGVFAWLGLLWKNRKRGFALETLAYTGFSILILNPLVWSYWVVLAIPGIAWILSTADFKKRVWIEWIAVLALLICGWSHQSRFARDGALLITSLGWMALLVFQTRDRLRTLTLGSSSNSL